MDERDIAYGFDLQDVEELMEGFDDSMEDINEN